MKKKVIKSKNYYGCANELDVKDKRQKRFTQQRKKWGFDDTETWSLYSTVLRFTLPRLKHFRDVKAGHPMGLKEKEWNEIVDKMIIGIEFALEEDWSDLKKMKKADEGLKLFFKWFYDLWW